MSTSAMSQKEALIRTACTIQGKRLREVARQSPWSEAHVYAVIRGDKTSAPVDQYLAKEFGINPETLKGTPAA